MTKTPVQTDTDVPASTGVHPDPESVTAEPVARPTDDDRSIPLDRLLRSPDNVRTLRPARDKADAELVASIRSSGLLENLVVVPAEGRDGWFEVTAGERRRLAHLALVKRGEFAPDRPVRCLVRSREQAVADSLAENIVRKDMHPADRYRAFARLVETGCSEQEIATQFGLRVADVRRYLRIGGLNKTLLGHFARDRMSFDAVLAYAGTADTALQLAVFKLLGSRPETSAAEVRRAIRVSRLPSDAGIVRFVGLANYRKAEGRTEEDLIEGTTQVIDLDVLYRLADERLATIAAAQEGWAWVESALPEDAAPTRFHRAPRAVEGVPDALAARLDALRAREAELEMIDYDDATPEERAEYSAACDEIGQIEDTIHAEHMVVDAACRPFAGCVVTFHPVSGAPVVHEGLQRPEDRAAQRAAEASASGEPTGQVGDDRDAPTHDEGHAAPVVSTALSRDLGRYRRATVRTTLARNASAATMLLQYHLCVAELGDYRHGAGLLALRGSPDSDETTRNDLETTDAYVQLAAVRDRLDVSWLEAAGHDACYAAFTTLSRARREALVAYCVARQLDTMACATASDVLPAALVEAIDVDIAALWRPTAINYFSRIRKDALIELGVEWYGEAFRSQARAASKASIVEQFERLLHGPDEGLSDAEREIRTSWLPIEMR